MLTNLISLKIPFLFSEKHHKHGKYWTGRDYSILMLQSDQFAKYAEKTSNPTN